MDYLDNLIQQISKLPGLGKRGATRIAYHLLKKENKFSQDLGKSLYYLKEHIHNCQICHNYTEGSICSLCQDKTRDPNLLCIVENPQEVISIESTGQYKGYFFVLHGKLSPLDGIGPEELGIYDLKEIIEEKPLKEIILATSSSPEGEATAIYLKQTFSREGLIFTRLASGLPVGGSLESADKLTMMKSLEGRTTLK